jgi:hypothetical protein
LVYQTLFEVKDKCLEWGKKFEIHFYLWQGGSNVNAGRKHFDCRTFGKPGRLSGNDTTKIKGRKPFEMDEG